MAYQVFTIITKQRLLSAIVLLLIGNSLAILLTQQPATTHSTDQMHSTLVLEPATAFEDPIPLDNGVIWHPPSQAQLIYQPYDGSIPTIYDWVNGIPVAWDIVPTQRADGIYHLIWQTEDGTLWRSQVNRNGQRVLASIEVVPQADNFRATTNRLGQTVLLWTRSGIVQGTVLDGRGRPLRQLTNLAQQATHMDVLANGDLLINLSWISDNNILHYGQSEDLNDIDDFATAPLSLPAGTWIDDFYVVRVESDVYSIWLQHHIETPTQSTLHGFRWRDGEFIDVMPGYTFSDMHPVYSRRARYAQPQLSARFFLDGMWQSGYFLLGDTQPMPLNLSEEPHSAPRLWFDIDDQIAATIRHTLNELNESRYAVEANVRPIPTSSIPLTDQQWLREGLMQSPRGVVWLMLPLGLVIIVLAITQQYPHALYTLCAFLAARIIYPMNLFRMPSVLLDDLSDTRPNAFFVLLAIDCMSIILAWGLLRPYRHAMLWGFFVISMLLNFVVFGAHLS